MHDVETGYVFGTVEVPLSRMLEDKEDLKLPLEEYDLATNGDKGGVVKFSAKLRSGWRCRSVDQVSRHIY